MANNVELLNNLSVITNYFEEFKNLDLDYTSTLNMKINEYLSAILEVQFVYDDNAFAALQFRQVFWVRYFLAFLVVLNKELTRSKK